MAKARKRKDRYKSSHVRIVMPPRRFGDAKIFVDGKEVDGVTAYSISHTAGQGSEHVIPRVTLEILAGDGLELEYRRARVEREVVKPKRKAARR